MKTILFLAIFLFSFGLQAQAIKDDIQQTECGTYFDPKDTIHLPHFGQNVILDQILDITMKGWRRATKASNVGIPADNVRFRIPVKIWVYRTNVCL
jgi:hypothetical protein